MVVLSGWWLWQNKSFSSGLLPFGATNQETSVTQTSSQTLGGSIYDKVSEQTTAAKNLPDTNPFNKDINPIKGAYTNPFGN